MKKERRENVNFEYINLSDKQVSLQQYLFKEKKRDERCGLLKIEYEMFNTYGVGNLIEYHFEGIVLSIINVLFDKNVLFENSLEVNALYLSFLLRGEMLLKFNLEEEIAFEDNCSFISYIKRFHGSIKFYSQRPFHEIKLKVSNSFLNKYQLTNNNQTKFKLLPITHRMYSIIEELQLNDGEGILKRIFLEAKILEIIAIQLKNLESLESKSIDASNQKNLGKIFQLKDFLNRNLDKNNTTNELSKLIGLSETLLKSEFKRVFNNTISKYWLNQKMKKSMKLLKDTDLPIYEIAEMVGYKNATHFSAAFKRFYHKTPKSYRVK